MNRKIIRSTPFGPVGIIWTGLNDNPKIVRTLLEKEGISFVDAGRVDCAQFHYERTVSKTRQSNE